MDRLYINLYNNSLVNLANLNLKFAKLREITDYINNIKESEENLHIKKCIANKMLVALQKKQYKQIIRLARKKNYYIISLARKKIYYIINTALQNHEEQNHNAFL